MIRKPGRSKSRFYSPSGGKSLTHQSFKAECDINFIVAHNKVHDPLATPSVQPMFGDFTSVPDIRSSRALIDDAYARFSDLPSRVRERFSNDPLRLLSFVADDSNIPEARLLGLLPPLSESDVPVAPAAGDVPAVNPVAP